MAMKIKVNDGKGKRVTGVAVEMVQTMIDMNHCGKKTPTKMTSPASMLTRRISS